MTISIKHNVIKSLDGKVKYKIFREGGKEQFHLGVWVDASVRELDSIAKVEYKLHPSFQNQVRFSQNRKNNFSVTFWTWGMFNIEISIYFHNGEVTNIDHYLKYDLPTTKSDFIEIK